MYALAFGTSDDRLLFLLMLMLMLMFMPVLEDWLEHEYNYEY